MNAVRSDLTADPVERARTLALLPGVALRAVKARDLTARLESAERALRRRRDKRREQEKRR